MLGDLGVVDRVGDLMQKKLRAIQAARLQQQQQQQQQQLQQQVASPRHKHKAQAEDGVICGSTAFHELAAYSSSYEGQVRHSD